MHHRQALDVALTTGDVFAVALALEGIGATLVAMGQPAAGAELVASGLAARKRLGTPLPPGERTDTDAALETAAQQLSRHEYEKAVDRGGELALDSAVTLANAAFD